MNSERLKNLSRPLTAVLILCLVLTMAPLLPMSDSDVQAAGGTPILTIVNGTQTLKVFDAADLNALPQNKATYSTINRRETYSEYETSGATLKSILDNAGINVNSISSSTNFDFGATDGYVTDPLTWGLLSENRYYFDETKVQKGVLPAIINSPNADDDPMRLFVGQLNAEDVNSGYCYSNVNKITITPAADLKPITLTLNANGGKSSVASMSLVPGKPYGSILNPTRKYFRFDGWFTAVSGGSKILPTTIVPNNNHSIFAHWTGTNTNLRKLRKSKGTLSRKFKATRKTYTLKLKRNQKSTRITATKAQSVSKIRIKVGKGKYRIKSKVTVKVARGKSKTVYIKVTAQNGKSKIYKVKVRRAK